MREEVTRLVALGAFPSERKTTIEQVEERGALVLALKKPATLEEALALLDIFPATEETYHGLAWSVVHFIESAPGWSDKAVAPDDSRYWPEFLRGRAIRGRKKQR